MTQLSLTLQRLSTTCDPAESFPPPFCSTFFFLFKRTIDVSLPLLRDSLYEEGLPVSVVL